MNHRCLRLALVVVLVAAGHRALAKEIPAEQVLALPGIAELLSARPAASSSSPTSSPLVVAAAAARAQVGQTVVLWAAVALVEGRATSTGKSPSTGKTRVLIAQQRGKAMVLVRTFEEPVPGVHSLSLGRHRPDGGLALAIHWASGPGHHEGKLQVWTLGDGFGTLAFEGQAEGCYFRDIEGRGVPQMVLYTPEADSLVFLPRLFDWSGERLVETKGTSLGLARQLLKDYDEVLDSFLADRFAGEPPLMVVDVALLKGRLLERYGKADAALRAYRQLLDIVSTRTASDPSMEGDRQEIQLRAAEAARRADRLARAQAKPTSSRQGASAPAVPSR